MTCTRCSKLTIEPICFECGRRKPWATAPRVVVVNKRRPKDEGMVVTTNPSPKPLAGGAAAKRERLDS
jgi:hypothetical protein